jgi:hypothetical protein
MRRYYPPIRWRRKNQPSSVQALRPAERYCKSDPAVLREFLSRFGMTESLTPWLTIDDSSGFYDEPLWEGSPEAWREHVERREQAGAPPPEPWSGRLRLVSGALADGYREDDPMAPYTRSMEALREHGWRKNPVDRTLGEAARILASSPGLMQEFLLRIGPQNVLEAMQIRPVLVVQHEDPYGDSDEWIGPLEKWPEKVEDDGIEGEDVEHWTLFLGRRILGGWPDYSEKRDKPATFVSDEARRRLERRVHRDEFWIPALKPERPRRKKKKKKRRKKASP